MVSRVRRVLLATLIALWIPAAAHAVTLDDIIALSKAGVTADILVAVIDADRTVFNLNRDEIVLLKRAGVPNSVIVKMLGTAREFVEEVPPPLIVGADRPKAPVAYPSPTYVAPAFVAVAPYYVVPYYPVFVAPVTPAIQTQPVHGFGRFMNDGWVSGRGFGRFMNNGFIDLSRVPAK